MIEAVCEKCGETFNPVDMEDLIHEERIDGGSCGGEGKVTGRW